VLLNSWVTECAFETHVRVIQCRVLKNIAPPQLPFHFIQLTISYHSFIFCSENLWIANVVTSIPHSVLLLWLCCSF
jgi:hypothetical protein